MFKSDLKGSKLNETFCFIFRLVNGETCVYFRYSRVALIEGRTEMNQTAAPVFYKNPGLAAILSFFYMGLGQIYNGQISKGIVFIIAYSLSWVLMILVIGFVTTPVMWIYGMYDAYKSAEKINADIARGASGGPGVN